MMGPRDQWKLCTATPRERYFGDVSVILSINPIVSRRSSAATSFGFFFFSNNTPPSIYDKRSKYRRTMRELNVERSRVTGKRYQRATVPEFRLRGVHRPRAQEEPRMSSGQLERV